MGFRKVIENTEGPCNQKTIDDLFIQLDADRNGYIDFNEFVDGIFSGKLGGFSGSNQKMSSLLTVRPATPGYKKLPDLQTSPVNNRNTDDIIRGVKKLHQGRIATKPKGVVRGQYARRDRDVALQSHLKKLMRSY